MSVVIVVTAVHWSERVFKDIIRDASALRYPLGLIEAPVDPKIDSALTVLFLSLREVPETARD